MTTDEWQAKETSFLSSVLHYDSSALRPEWMRLARGQDAYPEWQDEAIFREVFTEGYRVLGTETTVWRRYVLWTGQVTYTYAAKHTETRHFASMGEASVWRDRLFHARQLARVQGGTTREWINTLTGDECYPDKLNPSTFKCSRGTKGCCVKHHG